MEELEELKNAIGSVDTNKDMDNPDLLWEDIDNLRTVLQAARKYLALMGHIGDPEKAVLIGYQEEDGK